LEIAGLLEDKREYLYFSAHKERAIKPKTYRNLNGEEGGAVRSGGGETVMGRNEAYVHRP
jgi:hypothetical protein